MMRRNSGDRRGEVAVLLHRLGRLSFFLAAVTATGAAYMPGAGALAASRPTLSHGHGNAARPASKPARTPKRQRKRYARLSPVYGVVHHARAVHRDSVPLANTTWDDPQVPAAVTDAIQAASRESGVDPHLLTAIAWRESRFDPNARNDKSSAKGLLQFTTETWLQVVRDYGSQHNVGGYAAAIRRDPSGALVVSGRGMRAAILRLRDDPVLSAKLAAQNMSQRRAAMRNLLGRDVAPADFYFLHVLGPTGAARFLTAVVQRPSESSTEVASYEVLRNAGLLARDGRPMTVANTYAAAGAMLDAQRARSAVPVLAAPGRNAAAAAPVEISAAP